MGQGAHIGQVGPDAPVAPDATARYAGLDTLRALAIVAVMLFHRFGAVPAPLHVVTQFGWMGVDLFFVLSGYLIGFQLLKPYAQGAPPAAWEFYRKRLYRVLPAYLVVVGLYFCCPWWREDPHISPLWVFLTFTQNFVIDYRINYAFSQAWSLCVEEHFYLVLPLIAWAMMRRPRMWKTVAVLAGVAGAGMVVRGYVLMHLMRPLEDADGGFGLVYMERIYYPTYTHLDGLVAGVSLALMRLFRPGWWGWLMRRGNAPGGLGVVLIGVAVWLEKDRLVSAYGVAGVGTVIGFPVLAAGLGLLVACALSRTSWLGQVRVPGVKMVAVLSYSLYLTHKEIFGITARFFPALAETGGWSWLGLLACTCLAAAAVLYFAVERPFMLLRDRRRGRLGRRRVDAEVRVEPAL